MKIEYFGKDYTISDQLKKISAKKCRKLAKYFDAETVARFTVTLEKNSLYKTELVVAFGANILRAEAESENPYKNLDEVVPKIEAQMDKKRSIWNLKNLRKQNKYPTAPIDEESIGEVEEDLEPPKPEF